jgi:hypothetical protein
MSYLPLPVPSSPEELPKYLRGELSRISQLWGSPTKYILLAPSYAEPAKRTEGMVAFADGTTWNPGSGAGTYQYRSGTWQPWEGGGGGGGGGGLTAEQVMDTIAAMLTAGNGMTLTYADASDVLTVTSNTYSTRVTVNFGSGFTDKAQTVVTGQSWVTANSEFTAQVLTPSGTDPDEMYLLGMRVEISDIVAGTGFTVTVYSEAEASGNYTVMVIGTV